MKDRIDHNLRYNDDTIFDNFSIFQQLAKEDTTEEIKDPEVALKNAGNTEESTPQKLESEDLETSDHDSITPVIRILDRSSNDEESSQKVINLEDLAELTLAAKEFEDEELISYHEEDSMKSEKEELEKSVSY